MATDAQIVVDTLKQRGYGETTDLDNKFSYAGGMKNILGMRKTGTTLSLRIENPSSILRRVALVPTMISGYDVEKGDFLEKRDVSPFFKEEFEEDTGGGTETVLTIESLDADQELDRIAREASFVPFQITAMHMRSFNLETKNPESGNFGNVVESYFSTPWKKEGAPRKLLLSKFQSQKDNQLTLGKVDFVKENFPAFVSSNDMLIVQINPGTRLDLTFDIGARYSVSEYFNRQVREGMNLLNSVSVER